MSTEAQILADIEALRERVPDTQELYREVCAVLFFRYGITPTANKLYQYVRKGSMSAPAEALAKFWEDLREKSRVRIEHPDLPDVLKSAAGDLVATLWTQAQGAARESLAAFQSEAQAAVQAAESAKTSAENEQRALLQERDHDRQKIIATTERIQALERELSAEQARKAALSSQLEAAGVQQASLEAALAESRRDFAAELEKLRQALQRSEERCEASERRALLEIDRERTAALRTQKEMEKVRQHHSDVETRYRAEISELQAELGSARQTAGISEGMLQEARSRGNELTSELGNLRSVLAEKDSRIALQERDLAACQEKVGSAQQELEALRAFEAREKASPKPRRKSRKPGIDSSTANP